MKTSKITLLFAVIIITILTNCSAPTKKCSEFSEKEFIFLLDVSDKILFENIENDITQGFGHFMKNSPFRRVQECEKLSFKVGNLSGVDELKTKKTSIGISKKGLSGNDRKRLSNPKPIIRLLKESLDDFKTLSTDTKYSSNTKLLSTILKSIAELNEDNEISALLVFSDMVINNKVNKINFYRKIPDVDTVIKNIDQSLLKKARDKVNNCELKLIIVQKQEPNNKVQKLNVKRFWEDLFKRLGVKVEFVDNLSNSILW